MSDAAWVPLRAAWHQALYGDDGFYRGSEPADHFRTSAQLAHPLAQAVVTLVERLGATSLCDLGAGDGGLLDAVHRLRPRLPLLGVDLRGRPTGLADGIDWQQEMPSGQAGMVFANELLDNVPCDIVELADDGSYRLVETDLQTGAERPGPEVGEADREWLAAWWRGLQVGERAEVGLARDTFWARACRANPAAWCVAVDYGHLRGHRPHGGSLTSYHRGAQTAVTLDGRHDVTAHVAFDSLAAAVGGTPRRQRDVLLELGLSGARPPLESATTDPRGYLRGLARASEVAELTSVDGLGAWWWLVTPPAAGPSTPRLP